ncbi:MAG: hypothetical protein ABJ246_15485 [Paracoccaceae bacterium]
MELVLTKYFRMFVNYLVWGFKRPDPCTGIPLSLCLSIRSGGWWTGVFARIDPQFEIGTVRIESIGDRNASLDHPNRCRHETIFQTPNASTDRPAEATGLAASALSANKKIKVDALRFTSHSGGVISLKQKGAINLIGSRYPKKKVSTAKNT